jgi:hypothetical protein
MNVKTLKIIVLLFSFVILFSCESNDENETPELINFEKLKNEK